MQKVIVIDFDGCLCENEWSEIGTSEYGDDKAVRVPEATKC